MWHIATPFDYQYSVIVRYVPKLVAYATKYVQICHHFVPILSIYDDVAYAMS